MKVRVTVTGDYNPAMNQQYETEATLNWLSEKQLAALERGEVVAKNNHGFGTHQGLATHTKIERIW